MRTRFTGMAITAAVLLVLTACSDDGTPQGATQTPGQATTTATTSPTGGAATSPAAPSAGTRVEVVENEFSIELSRSDFSPGTYTFVVSNQGKADHDLAIMGPGVDGQTEILASSATGELTVTLQPGTYELWCTVGNHRARGMEQEITVSG
jgi:uncharacterized cupredoxin-like copper-binding protein